jgi:hypothetical protein
VLKQAVQLFAVTLQKLIVGKSCEGGHTTLVTSPEYIGVATIVH